MALAWHPWTAGVVPCDSGFPIVDVHGDANPVVVLRASLARFVWVALLALPEPLPFLVHILLMLPVVQHLVVAS